LLEAGKGNERGHVVKLLWYDGQGMCLFSKRLEKGHFIWPVTETGRVSLTPAQLSMLRRGLTGACRYACAGLNWRAELLTPVAGLLRLRREP
jgi:transposase